MADQTVRIEDTGLAAVTAQLARELWITQTGYSPKATDAAFFELVVVCNFALRGSPNTMGYVESFMARNFKGA
ncbi:hypothetical protein ACTTAI_02690 [Rhodobacter capsulatus]|uniref:hypothetical protein n=1 Tax=Rhodobacter capsulatus TaxID=1061 RepID=UPI004026B098